METIQVVARGQEVMARIQEEMQQRANDVATTVDPFVPPQGNNAVQIHMMTPGRVSPPVVNPPVIEIDDQHDAFSIPRSGSVYDAFGQPTAEMEKKVCAIEEKLKAMEGSNTIGLDAAEMCLVPRVRIPAKFKVTDFKKYKGASDPRTHIRSYCRKMVAYSDGERLLMHLF